MTSEDATLLGLAMAIITFVVTFITLVVIDFDHRLNNEYSVVCVVNGEKLRYSNVTHVSISRNGTFFLDANEEGKRFSPSVECYIE